MSEENLPTVVSQVNQLTNPQINLIKRQICKGATDDELKLFIMQCNRTGLDPFSRQIYSVKRWNSKEQKEEMTVQTSIDGLRLIAERSGKYQGQTEPLWCGEDGVWVDVWLSKTYPFAAKAGVYKQGFKDPLYAIAKWDSYAQKDKNGKITFMWEKMPDLMLHKCAESLALRKAFPAELSGLYTGEEMSSVSDLDSSIPKLPKENTPTETQKNLKPTQSQLKRLYAITKANNWEPIDVTDFMNKEFQKTSSSELSIIEYNLLCDFIQNNPN